MNNIQSKIESFDQKQNDFSEQILSISKFMNEDLAKYFNNLHLNKFQADCVQPTHENREFKFDVKFNSKPDVFAVTNRFLVKYGTEGRLEKKSVDFNQSADKIIFNIGDDEMNNGIPICYLATEKVGN